MEERVGFVGIVMEDLASAGRVNAIVGQYQEMVTGRIGVPDHERRSAVIGLIVRGSAERVSAFTARLGNVPGVTVKSALTSKVVEKEQTQINGKEEIQ